MLDKLTGNVDVDDEEAKAEETLKVKEVKTLSHTYEAPSPPVSNEEQSSQPAQEEPVKKETEDVPPLAAEG